MSQDNPPKKQGGDRDGKQENFSGGRDQANEKMTRSINEGKKDVAKPLSLSDTHKPPPRPK